MEDLNDLYFFACVVERGSFTRAAEALGVPKSRLSRRVADLEGRLGVLLLERTTRRLHLTTEGELFLSHCQAMMVEAKAGLEALERMRSEPQGTVRVAAPVDVAQHVLAPLLPEFLALYPKVRLEVNTGARMVDLIEEGFDAALRVRTGALEDPRLEVRALQPMELVLAAAPRFLGDWSPGSPEELVGRLSGLAGAAPGQSSVSLIGPQGEVARLEVEGRLAVNDFSVLAEAARAGLGVTLLPLVLVQPGLADGSLCLVLPEWRVTSGHLRLVYPPARARLPSVRAFLSFIRERLAPD